MNQNEIDLLRTGAQMGLDSGKSLTFSGKSLMNLVDKIQRMRDRLDALDRTSSIGSVSSAGGMMCGGAGETQPLKQTGVTRVTYGSD